MSRAEAAAAPAVAGKTITSLEEFLGLTESKKNEVTKIDLSGQSIGDARAAALAEVLKGNKSVTIIDLSGNNIGDTGAAAIAEALRVNKTVTSVNLFYNDIGDTGAAAIADALRVNETVTRVDFGNHNIGGEMLSRITALLTPAAITERRCRITAPKIAKKFAIFCYDLRTNSSGKYEAGVARQKPLTAKEGELLRDPKLCQKVMEIFYEKMLLKEITREQIESDDSLRILCKASPDFEMVYSIAEIKATSKASERLFPHSLASARETPGPGIGCHEPSSSLLVSGGKSLDWLSKAPLWVSKMFEPLLSKEDVSGRVLTDEEIAESSAAEVMKLVVSMAFNRRNDRTARLLEESRGGGHGGAGGGGRSAEEEGGECEKLTGEQAALRELSTKSAKDMGGAAETKGEPPRESPAPVVSGAAGGAIKPGSPQPER